MIEFNATLLVSIISFVVFMFIMNMIFYNPILSIMRKREDYIRTNYTDSEQNNEGAKELKEEYEKEFETAKQIARKKMNEEIEQSQKLADEKVHQVRDKAKNEIQSKKEILIQEKNNIVKSVNTEDLANIITDKILR